MSEGLKAKDFILTRTALNRAELARLINWQAQGMNEWLKGRRGIPNGKLQVLEALLADYGYNSKNSENA